MPKISLIIAMYNIQNYIAYCISSCLNQKGVSPKDYEIIIVNDGSTDESLIIAEKAIYGQKNAKIITRVNGGLSEARNTGLKEAKADYVWFIDGDDAIDENAIGILLSHIEKYSYDAYLFNFSTFETKAKLNTSDFALYFLPMSGEDVHFKYNEILPLMAWLTVYKKDLLIAKHIYFMSGIVHEDFEFSVRAHHLSKSIGFIAEDLYLYRVARNDSIMSDSRKDNTKSLVAEIKILNSFKDFFSAENNKFTRHLYGLCATSFLIRQYDSAFVKNETTVKLILDYKKILYKDMWNSREWKRRCLLLFIIIAPVSCVSKVLYRIGERSKLM